MKNIRLLLIVTIIIAFCADISYSQSKISKRNIEKFSLSAYTATIDNSDSLRISVFIQIPYSSLQYVKKDSQFIARYEATIAVQTKKGQQLGREVWQDSIVVKSYNRTKSISENQTLMVSYKIPPGKYKVVGNLLDLDTKNVGKNSKDIDVVDYKNKRFLHPPILIENFNGEWGFGENLIPAINNRSFNMEDGLLFYLSGKVSNGKYRIKNQYFDKNGKVVFEETIEDTSENGMFEHLTVLPTDNIQGMSVKLKSELFQKTTAIEESTTITLKKVGVSHLINDMDEALEQMRYILSTKERKKVKKASLLQSEKLFKDLWKLRDPSPESTTNELMNEYYRRVSYSNAHFGSFKDGWETDMGMVYIILGPPDDIEKFLDNQYQEPYERWYYYRIQESYTFIGDNFGNYTLLTPFFGYRR